VALLALGTAFCTALGGIIMVEVAPAAGGAMALSRWRTLIASLVLIALTGLARGWSTLRSWHVAPIVLSSLLAVVVADPALNASYGRIGARRTALLFALTAPFAALLGWLVLGETLGANQLAGSLLVVAGIVLAVAFGQSGLRGARVPSAPQKSLHAEARGTPLAIFFGLLAALAQAAGTLAVRPVMADRADPFAVMALRAIVACVVLWAVAAASTAGGMRPFHLPSPRTLGLIGAGAAISFVLGMTLMMAALSGTSVAIASTLAATAPVAVLPMLWLRTGQKPAWQAWCGAALTVGGIGLIFLR